MTSNRDGTLAAEPDFTTPELDSQPKVPHVTTSGDDTRPPERDYSVYEMDGTGIVLQPEKGGNPDNKDRDGPNPTKDSTPPKDVSHPPNISPPQGSSTPKAPTLPWDTISPQVSTSTSGIIPPQESQQRGPAVDTGSLGNPAPERKDQSHDTQGLTDG